MNTDRRRILDMLAKGTITAEEAEQLLQALESQSCCKESGSEKTTCKCDAKFLRIQVTPTSNFARHKEPVNIKVPILLIKAGLKIPGLLSENHRDRVHDALGKHGVNIDMNKLDGKTVDELVAALMETSIEVDGEDEHVRICCE